MFNELLSDQFIERFLLNTISLLILLRWVYFSHAPNRDSLFGFFLFGQGVFLITGLMHEINISMGFAFGLFAVLSMLRYRTESISIRDMTYLFLVIVMSLMAAVGPIGIPSLMLVNTVVIAMVWVSETTGFAPRTVQKPVTYDNTKNIRHENHAALIADLSARLGEEVLAATVVSVDFLKDTAELRVTLTGKKDKSKQSLRINSNEKQSTC